MKRVCLCIGFFCVIFTLVPQKKQAKAITASDIIISEFLPAPGSIIDWDGDGSADSKDEWVELLNTSESTIDLGDWQLDDVI